MSTPVYYALGVLVMAVVTYIPRVLPLSLMRRRVESRFLQSFLYYMLSLIHIFLTACRNGWPPPI